MFATPKLLTLASGHQIACDEYGDPAGQPVIFIHGWPASRLQGSGFGPDAEALGARIFALDRPGVGLSTFVPGRRLLDWPPVLREVAHLLGLSRFRVLAVSGGGPYALASAWALPDLVQAAAVVSGAPPLRGQVAAAHLLPIYRMLLAVHRRFPELLRLAFRAGKPVVTLRPPQWLAMAALALGPQADRSALSVGAVYDGSFACYREAWRGSALGVAADGEIYAQPWGFAPEEIRVPVRLWHGQRDRSFGWPLAQALGDSIPGCHTRIVPEEGHYSLPIHHSRAILADLLGVSDRVDHESAVA